MKVPLAFAIVVLMLGCSRTDPVSTERGKTDVDSATRGDLSRLPSGFYPLGIGNRWRYTETVTVVYILDGQPPSPPETDESAEEHEQICREVLDGREYTVEERHQVSPDVSRSFWSRHRQDATGLYQADIAAITEPECMGGAPKTWPQDVGFRETIWSRMAEHIEDETVRSSAKRAWSVACDRLESMQSLGNLPVGEGGAAVSMPELTRLRYPLYPGQSWFIRTDMVAKVEARELVSLPIGRVPAFRIALDGPPIFNGEISTTMWWGQCGYLGKESHFELDMLDETGEPIGVMIGDASDQVTDVRLVDLRPCTIEGE